MPKYPAPVIFLPGIMGSSLRDEYPVGPETVWSVLRAAVKSYDRITLHPDDLRYELREPARVVRDQVFELFYKEIIEELRHNLSPSEEEIVPVYPFAYDWRQPLALIEQQLAAFIEEVVARTSLLKHYHGDGYTPATGKVNLVAHSMGGLVVGGYVAGAGLTRVDKVATLASPFRGSLEAIAKTTLGTGGFSFGSGASREREAARVTPALYHLLPSFDGAIKPVKRDIFLQENWQPGILATLAAFIERHGLDSSTDEHAQARLLLTSMLDQAWDHRTRLEGLQLPDPKRWLCIVGVGAATRLSVKITTVDGGPFFTLADPENQWKPKKPSTATGDSTVPYAGARPAFLPAEQIVCVSPDDFGFFEFRDKLINELGFHSAIPNMDLVQRLVITHLRPGNHPQGKLGGHPSPEIPAAKWDPPVPIK